MRRFISFYIAFTACYLLTGSAPKMDAAELAGIWHLQKIEHYNNGHLIGTAKRNNVTYTFTTSQLTITEPDFCEIHTYILDSNKIIMPDFLPFEIAELTQTRLKLIKQHDHITMHYYFHRSRP